LAKTAPDEFDLNLQVQVRSAFKIARVILPQMAKNRSGKVVFVLSSCVLEPVKFLTSYQTAKFALLGLMHSLSAEFAEKSVCVNAVAPAMMDTQFLSEVPDLIKELERQKASTKELLSASDTAKNIKMLLADDAPNGIIQPVSVI
jgi:3-oxoacyl-[acyl-carrier protein] reductase